MRIKNLCLNNIQNLDVDINTEYTIAVGGLSGSGKTSFCSAISDESLRRIISLLPKSEYSFIFSNLFNKKYTYDNIEELPLTFFLGKPVGSSNPRSTVGTHTGIYSIIRTKFSQKYHIGSEFFSFNNSATWCPKCKGRGSTSGVECKECQGNRYSKEAYKYTLNLNGKETSIIDINLLNFFQLKDISGSLFTDKEKNIIDTIINLKIGYLSLNRVVSTLSGGERLRLMLAEFLVSCDNSLLILDEISSGVDINTLKIILSEVDKLGHKNQIWLIDHSDYVLTSTKKTLYFGPGSGNKGGNIVDESPRPLPENQATDTTEPLSYYELKSLSKRNINLDSISIPKNRLTVITGESGCGKSTLVNECLPIALKKDYKKTSYILIGQSRNQSITSKSTISTFLDIKKFLKKKPILSDEFSILDLDKSNIKLDEKSKRRINLLIDLGVGYLTMNRTIQSLSSGEFQCVHMVSCLFNDDKKDIVLAFDEPSAGLSQNILNKFLFTLRKILSNTSATIIMIEHNEFLINNSDYIINFGVRTNNNITELYLQKNDLNNDSQVGKTPEPQIFISGSLERKSGIKYLTSNQDEAYTKADNEFKGGVLKQISPTAQWIYKDYITDIIKPIITIDFESNLYSKSTYVFEIANLINLITQKYRHNNILSFDLLNKSNQCPCCKGKKYINVFDINIAIQDSTKGIWDGLFKDDIMFELKRYNFSKIKFLFKEIKKETNLVLDKPYCDMSSAEKKVFLYGYWDKEFYDTDKQTNRLWKGIIFLIQKYMRESKKDIKDKIKDNCNEAICPICSGTMIRTSESYDIGGKDIRDILTEPIANNYEKLDKINLLREIKEILGYNFKLTDDVSELPLETQVKLKCLELHYANLFGFTIVLKNVYPFFESISKTLNKISINNEILICDYESIKTTKESILSTYFDSGNIKRNSFVYEIAKLSKISTLINKAKKASPCKYCKGKGSIKENSIFDGIDTTEFVCNSCNATGIDKEHFNDNIENISIKTWMFGTLKDLHIIESDDEILLNLPLMTKIKDLNKPQLMSIINYCKK